MTKYLPLALLALVLSCRTAPTPAPEDGSVLVSDRLSNQRVNAFTEDSDGHIWIATSRGLNKYTVHEYIQFFASQDSVGLPDNQINDVLTASDGTIWVATNGGAARREQDGRFHRVRSAGWNPGVSTLMEPKPGLLLMAGGSELLRYDAGSDALVSVIGDLNPFGSPSTVCDGASLWVLSAGGWAVNRYSLEDFSLLGTAPLKHQAYHICDTGSDEIWLSGMGRLSIIDKTTMGDKPLPRAVSRHREVMDGDVDLIYSVDGNSILLSVIGKGLFEYDRTTGLVSYQDDPGFPYEVPSAEIHAIFRDSRQNLWFGTANEGFSVSFRYKEQFNRNKYLTDAFRHKAVTSLCQDGKGRLWITTYRDGLFVYDGSSLKTVEVSHLIDDHNVGYIRATKVFCDSSGDMWLLFSDKYRVVRCAWDGRRLTLKDSFFHFIPMSIAEDEQGKIWIGGGGAALMTYDRRARKADFVQLPVPEGWTFITELLPYKPGYLIAAAMNHIVFTINTYTGEAEENLVSAQDRELCFKRGFPLPNCIFKDSGGDVWIGTSSNGLLRHFKDSGRTEPVQGLPCESICAIQEDSEGNVWVSTLNGLAKYDRAAGQMISYYEADGTGGNQFSERAAIALPDGTIIFGGAHGLTSFTPLEVSDQRTVPLVFEYLKIHNTLVQPGPSAPVERSLTTGPEVVIKHNENAFSIAFAALDYGEHVHMHYKYMMEGFDQDWVDSGTSGEAYYANIPSGRYNFRIRLSGEGRNVISDEQVLRIRVLPPWYATWWAIIIWTLLGGLLVGMGYTFWAHVRRVRREAAERIREVKLEQERAEMAEQEEKKLNKIQMNYFSNVAHEFRTPLTMIAGPAGQLAASENIKGEDRALVDIIRRNSAWMLSLVNQLLDFNRIGNRKLQMKVAKMDIVPPLKSIADLFRFNAQSKGIELATTGLEESFTMWVDADKVQKILMNLLSNALKFTPSGGKVTLSFDVISRADAAALFPLTDEDTDGQYAAIRVSDTGPGIPEEEMEKIFERFYQGASKSNTHGSGIGLYYARVLITLHHGYIKAINRPGGGAEFCFIVPVSASSYTKDERTDTEPQNLITESIPEILMPEDNSQDADRKHIAVVDDDIDIANYIKILLQQQYRVSIYFDVASALRGMQDDAPDLVISDVVMPGESGYQLCEKIKGDLQLSHIPVVLVTAKVAVESQVQGLDKGADAYVSKPFQPQYLLALVKSLLENREKLRRQIGSATTTESIPPEALSPRDAAFMRDLYALMEKELANADLEIVKVCEMMKISRTKFYYKVKGLTGENPSVFFKHYKLNRAAELLREGKYNMSEIAWMTGFNTLSHFSTSFKKQFGVPPSEYTG